MRPRLTVGTSLALGGLLWAIAHWLAHRTVSAPAPLHQGHGGHGTPAPEPAAAYLSTSLALCLALARAIAVATAAAPRARRESGRSLWLFGVVPVLGFLAETAASPPASATAAVPLLAELAPVVLLIVGVHVAVALVAVRVASGIVALVVGLAWSLLAPLRALRRDGGRFPHALVGRAPSPRASRRTGQRAPPAAFAL
ncbi:MAG TPA: hypothetical protein VD704_05345 [Gaiellaceae bacterium]|nr:hypothetical protein [Gaiellaceae bacterium]